MLVHVRLEMPLPSAFDGLAITLVFWNVGDDAMVPQKLARCLGIKATIRIEKCAFDVQAAPLQIFECALELLQKLITIIVVAGDDARRRDNVAVGIGEWQDVAGLGFLAALIGDFFAPFFGSTVAAIEVDF